MFSSDYSVICVLFHHIILLFPLSTSPLTVDRSRPMPTTVTRLFTPRWRGMFLQTRTKRKPTPRTSSRGFPCGDNPEVIPVSISARRSDCCCRGGGGGWKTISPPPPLKWTQHACGSQLQRLFSMCYFLLSYTCMLIVNSWVNLWVTVICVLIHELILDWVNSWMCLLFI